MEKFEPIKRIKTDKPTVVMLSHVQYVKDLKCAIMAADLIVNKWGFIDYRLHIYGDMERAASISTECQLTKGKIFVVSLCCRFYYIISGYSSQRRQQLATNIEQPPSQLVLNLFTPDNIPALLKGTEEPSILSPRPKFRRQITESSLLQRFFRYTDVGRTLVVQHTPRDQAARYLST